MLKRIDGRGLPGAVGADQPHDLSGGDVEVQPVHHHSDPVRLAQTSHGHYITFAHVLGHSFRP